MRAWLAACFALAFAAPAAAEPLTAEERDEVRELVRAYILENPEIIEEALIALQIKREEESLALVRARIAEASAALYEDPRDFSIGPADAPVQIVEFFDYNCGFCKRAAPWIKNVLETHEGKVRVVFKEAPIFAERYESSTEAARLALSAIEKDKYLDVHFALMEARGTLTTDQVNDIAKRQGLNMRWLRNMMSDADHDAHLTETLEL
ncbi:MAG: thioredoxin domain-containing protein, partial [Caulobacterales bacterium]|nr:thioredoxin domain-containing protein [Caulobacterales bacterium]